MKRKTFYLLYDREKKSLILSVPNEILIFFFFVSDLERESKRLTFELYHVSYFFSRKYPQKNFSHFSFTLMYD